MRTQFDAGMLGAALIGYQRQLEQIKMRMEEIRTRLRGRAPLAFAETTTPITKHRISAAGRARIAAAQRKRWAAARRKRAAA